MDKERLAGKSPTFLIFSALCLWVASAPVALAQNSSPAPHDSLPVAEQRAFLNRYCVTCHNSKLRTAQLSLQNLNTSDVVHSGEVLEKVVRKLATGAMPPASAPKPDKAKVQAFLTSLETTLDQAAAAHPNPGRPMMMHRLNRTEYLNSVQNLFHADLSPHDTSLLPPDDTSFGFDNNGDILGLSPLLLERYLSVAERVTTAALGPTSGVEADVYTHHVDFTVPQREWIEGLPFGTRGGTTFTYRFPVDGEYTIRVKLQRVETAVLGLDDNRPQRLEFDLDDVRVGLFAISLAKTVKEPLSETADELLARPDEPQTKLTPLEQEQRSAQADAGIEVRLFVKAGERRVSVAFLTRYEGVSDLVQQPLASGQGGPPRLLGVDSVFVAGPFHPEGSGDPVAKARILTCQPNSLAEETPCARKILEPLAHRAFRRPLAGADVDHLLTAFAEGRKDSTFEAGIATGIRRMLMDPAFLFRIEQDPANLAPNTAFELSHLELASRLSFFLWSSIPDQPLLTAAEQGRLKDPTVLRSQLKRMLADPRARNLVTNFGGQWLQLATTEGAHPDPVIFTDFDDSLRRAFIRETELLLENVLLGDRSVLELLSANYTFVNERLATHYGIPGVYGDQFRRVEVNDGIRGGLLGQGSILAGTSYPNRTSPVLRGKWVLDTVLGSPPPPPPPNVPALQEAGESGKVLSVRERLTEHRKNPACASCHLRMDPLGFALENFDATGAWRTVEKNGPADLTPQPIDASAQLPDGTKFSGVSGLRQILLARSDQFVYTMAERLFTFALGRGADWYDAPAIREVVRAAQKDGYRFSSLVSSIVFSRPFQMRMSQDGDRARSAALPHESSGPLKAEARF
jgi:Protein of unknown function (DUF1592)/Protein of unknown function (DUF1588)/Protein of unknown function (DUF1585)/Protein of unknown function (DUF1587)/Protein of unknown function (DUF1595)